jgi:hypothetical protein
MSGLRSLHDDSSGDSDWRSADADGEHRLPAIAIPLALAIHRATYAGEAEITINDLASATGIPIIDVFKGIALFEKRRLVRIRPGEGDRLAPVDWLHSTRDEQLHLMGMSVIEMTPFLPSLLEGRLDYSPAADDADVAAVAEPIEPRDFPHPDELVARINLPHRRAREALARYLRGPLDVGMRLRITVEVTFPDMTHDNASDLRQRLLNVIATNTSVRCEDVKLKEVQGIG